MVRHLLHRRRLVGFTAPLLFGLLGFCGSVTAQIGTTDQHGDRPPPYSVEAPRQSARKASPSRRPLRIPFEYVNGFIVVPVRLSTIFETYFIFDTGSSHTIVTHRDIVPYLGRELEERIRIVGSDLSLVLYGNIVRKAELGVGPLLLRSQSLIVLEDGDLDLATMTGRPVYGILGLQAFGAYAVTVDYRSGSLLLEESRGRNFVPRAHRRSRNSSRLPLRVERQKAYLNVFTQVHDGYADSLSLLIDTGASLESLLHVGPADTLIYPDQVVTGPIGLGLGGGLMGYVGRADKLGVGPFEVPEVVMHFQTIDADTLSGALPYRSGLLGNGVLDRFTFTLDLPNRHLYLAPRRGRFRRRAYDRSGLTLVNAGRGLDQFVVQRVGPGSPADSVGLRSGDRVTHLNGIPVSLLSLAGARRRLSARAGKAVRLRVQRGGNTFKYTLRLRERI